MKQGSRRRTDPTDGEWEILKNLWEKGDRTAPDVQEALAATRNWSYSTVRTMMDRMVKKGILKAKKVRNLTIYQASLTREQARRTEISRTLKRAFDGALAPMMELLLDDKDLTGEELEEIEKLVRNRKDGPLGKRRPSKQ